MDSVLYRPITAYLHLWKAAVVCRRHAHIREDRRGRSWPVWRPCWTGVVLTATPRKTDTGVADRVALHLVDSHLSRVTLYELDEAATLARWNLDVGNLAEALEEGAELIFGDIARQATYEDSGVVGVGELIHRHSSSSTAASTASTATASTAIVANWRSTHAVAHAHVHTRRVHTHWTSWCSTTTLVLWRSSGDAHRSITTVDALHLGQSTLLLALVGEAHKTVTTRHATDWI